MLSNCFDNFPLGLLIILKSPSFKKFRIILPPLERITLRRRCESAETSVDNVLILRHAGDRMDKR